MARAQMHMGIPASVVFLGSLLPLLLQLRRCMWHPKLVYMYICPHFHGANVIPSGRFPSRRGGINVCS